MAEMSRRHNNANVLALAARVTGDDLAIKIAEVWLKTDFDGGRHERRVEKIGKIESCR
jgi:ribose 5-phosphate isomerase B